MTQEQFNNLPDQERLDLLIKHKDNPEELFSDYGSIKPDDSYYPKYPLEKELVAAKKRIEELEEENMRLHNDRFDLAKESQFLHKEVERLKAPFELREMLHDRVCAVIHKQLMEAREKRGEAYFSEAEIDQMIEAALAADDEESTELRKTAQDRICELEKENEKLKGEAVKKEPTKDSIVKVEIYTHSSSEDSSIGFEESDLRITHIGPGEFIERGDLTTIFHCLEEEIPNSNLSPNCWYSFTLKRHLRYGPEREWDFEIIDTERISEPPGPSEPITDDDELPF